MRSTPRRVLHVLGAMNRGGAETFVMNVFRHLDRTKVVFDFAVNTAQPCHFDEEILDLGGRIFRHSVPRAVGVRPWTTEFARTLATAGPFAAVHSHLQHFSGFVLREAARHGVPGRIAHSHNVTDGCRTTLPRRAYRRYARFLLLRHATHLAGCSAGANRALFGRGAPRATVIANGIDPDLFRDGQPAAEDRRALGIPPDAFVVGHAGRFDVQKNHRAVIDIFEAVQAETPGAVLVLAGAGPLEADVRAMVEHKGLGGSVVFLGVRADMPRVLRTFDVLLLPSLWEGFPVVLVEAQAAGVPCIVSDHVTSDADLRVVPFEALPLSAPPSAWARTVLASAARPRPDWTVRRDALVAANCDIRQSVGHMSAMYAEAA